MKKRIAALLLAAVLLCAALPISAGALPNGWWPVWSAYQTALESGDEDAILAAGDKVIQFYSGKALDNDVANQLYMVYFTRLDNLMFENRSDYDAAINNCEKLIEICRYLNSLNNGQNYDDMINRCENHITVLPPETGVYAVSYTQSNTYGSKYAAASGTYYGSVAEGHYNEASICSFYVHLEGNTAGEFFYLIEPKANGQRVILINLNFENEGDTARAIPKGTYDNKLRSNLNYLSTLRGPVLLRIGAEMNVWTKTVTPEEYIAAYNYVAAMARSLAPNVELVWSPNYSSGWTNDMDKFYPDDSLVDWVGMSLYYNYESLYDDLFWLEAVHQGRFADPVYNADAVVKIARTHNKPVIATEGGTKKNGSQGEAYAVRQVAKEFSTLTMVYPDVKAIVYFDKVSPNGDGDYTLTGSILNAANDAVAANPSLIKSGSTSAGTWVPVGTFSEPVTGVLTLGATGRTFQRLDMGAVYKLDGKQIASTAASPNHCKINADTLSTGRHKLEVTLSDGFGYSKTLTYTLKKEISGVITITEGYTDIAGAFTDVNRNAYYYPAVVWAADNDVTTGTGATTFSPDSTCTRGQVVTFLWRAMGKPEPVSTVNPFTDVRSTDYFFKAVLWAVEQGITNGTTASTFSPHQTCSNAHIITFLWRTMGSPNKTGSGEWYEDAVNWADGKGLTSNIGKQFVTGADCPRADVVTFLYRVLAK